MIGARLAVLAAGARSILLASPRAGIDTVPLAEELARGLGTAEAEAAVIRPSENRDLPPSAAGPTPVTIIGGAGLLDDPATLLATRMADAVIVVIRREKTARRDLDDVRRQLDAAGARLIGSILLD